MEGVLETQKEQRENKSGENRDGGGEGVVLVLELGVMALFSLFHLAQLSLCFTGGECVSPLGN